MTFRLTLLVILLVSLCLAVTPVLAQTQQAQISGRITDPTGAVIVGANISLANLDTGIKTVVASNEEGYYTATLLQPGNYSEVYPIVKTIFWSN